MVAVMSALAHSRALRRLPGLRATRGRLLLGLVALVLLLGLAWLWLRDSALVSVDRVTVTGARGPDAAAIRRALASAARGMTTLDLNTGQLRTAVSPYPEVKGLKVTTQLPHGIRIQVIEQLPVAQVLVAGRAEPVAADGTVLRSSAAAASLPAIALSVPPGGPRLTETAALDSLKVLGAAPYRMLAKISRVGTLSGHGLVAQLRNGPAIYFGDSRDLSSKWTAAMAVLADPGSAGASYIDVTDPARPAAGATSTASTSSTSTASASSTNSVSSTSSAGVSSAQTAASGSSSGG
jgi:cell division protein FtsQ